MRSPRWGRTRRLTRGIWLAGIGLMLIRNRIWPDLLFLAGAVRLVEAYHHPERRRSMRVGVVLIALGLFVACRVGLLELLLIAAAGVILYRMLDQPDDGRKPAVDMRLE